MQSEVLTAPPRPSRPRIEQLDRLQAQDWPAWLAPRRKAAFERFLELGFPTIRHEDWRFTNVSALAKLPLKPVTEYGRDGVTEEQLKRFHFSRLDGPRLVFINGHYSPELSAPATLKDGTRAVGLRAELQTESGAYNSQLRTQLTADVRPETAFAALNTALFQDGAFVYVPAGKSLDKPIHLVFITTSDEPGAMASPRNVIVAEPGSSATVL
jgi:Fe-S cluster assembly protein SufD